ncbi:MAG: tetratricopeptide repeat protein, partial [Chloroflexi bacterium]|nr:tetratricopeptide repeat protein [Chloroflexota bacterium]
GLRYGGGWNRLISIALHRLRRRWTARLLGSAIFSLLSDPEDHPNSLVVVKRHGRAATTPAHFGNLERDYVYNTILERPAPSCWVLSPFREVLFLDQDQPPTRSEVAARQFSGLRVTTEREVYELLLGTTNRVSVDPDTETLDFVGRILDIVYLDFEDFLRKQSSHRFEAAMLPGLSSSDDLQLWLLTQALNAIYPGSLCEISETSQSSQVSSVLASSVARPWEPSPWNPPKNLEMLVGYTSQTGIPLVVETVEHPWTSMIESVESEMRYLGARASKGGDDQPYSALSLPLVSSAGSTVGSLYVLMPRPEKPRIDVEVRVLTVFSRIVGEIMERQRAAIHSATVSTNVANRRMLDRESFRSELLDLLTKKAVEIRENEHLGHDVRLPFLMLSAHRPDPDESDPADAQQLKDWLVDTLRHLDWRSFLWSRLRETMSDSGTNSFIGELPGVGVLIALGNLVSKDELDRIRAAFPTTINRTEPTNAPVKLVAWVLDVPGDRILDADTERDLQGLADDVEEWASEVATVVDDVAQSEVLAREKGEWDAALRRVRRALRKEGGRKNGYLYRLAVDCSFSLGEWQDALKYAREAAALSREEMGSGFVRSTCQLGDAYLCTGDPVRALDIYCRAVIEAPRHPLPRYYRGQGLMLIARLVRAYEDERRRTVQMDDDEARQFDDVVNTLVSGAREDLTSGADLLDRWGLIPQSYQYRNFHLVPTLMGQGSGYLLTRSPGPAASRLQTARRSFPKDDLFFREFLFAKCWEQGLHRRYAEMLLGDEWAPLRDRLQETFGEPPGRQDARVW